MNAGIERRIVMTDAFETPAVWLAFIAANTSAVSTTVANSPWRLASETACTSIGVDDLAVRAGQVVGAGGVRHDVGAEAQVACDSRRGLHAVIGDEPGDDDGVDSRAPQSCLQVGADEGAVRLLFDERFTWQWLRVGLDGVSGL